MYCRPGALTGRLFQQVASPLAVDDNSSADPRSLVEAAQLVRKTLPPRYLGGCDSCDGSCTHPRVGCAADDGDDPCESHRLTAVDLRNTFQL